jgi:transposase
LSRGDLTEAEWRILDPPLPDRGERRPPVEVKRRAVNGILWVLRTGAPWRDLLQVKLQCAAHCVAKEADAGLAGRA